MPMTISYMPDVHEVVRIETGGTSDPGLHFVRIWFEHRNAWTGFRGEKADVTYFHSAEAAEAFARGVMTATTDAPDLVAL